MNKRKVSLKFMDLAVSIEGGQQGNTESDALELLRILVKDRIAVIELMNELEHHDDDAAAMRKKKTVQPESELEGYQ